MKSSAQISGHPIHPMLVLLPAGAFITTLVLDAVYLLTGSELWWEATVPVMIVGLIGAIIAAIPGVIDYLNVAKPEGFGDTAFAHMGLNGGVIAVFTLNMLLRLGAPVPEGFPVEFWFSVLGVLLLGASGWLGGKMVYEGGIGVLEAERGEKEVLPGGRRSDELPTGEASEASGGQHVEWEGDGEGMPGDWDRRSVETSMQEGGSSV